MRSSVVLLLLLPSSSIRSENATDWIGLKYESDRPIRVEHTIKYPHTTSSQIIRILAAVTGLGILVYGLLFSDKDSEERCLQTGVGVTLFLGAIYFHPTKQEKRLKDPS